MTSFFQKYRVFWIVVAYGLSLFGLVVWEGRHTEALVLFTIPGVMLGVFMYLINNNKSNPTKTSNEVDELLKWYQVKESGAILEDEYEAKKKEIFMPLINNNKSYPTKTSNEADELLKWYQLKESGAISEDEYEAKKKEFIPKQREVADCPQVTKSPWV